MNGFHPTISRRDFMKGLGLAGATVGATALVGPTFHDVDEALASPTAITKQPWWVKSVTEPTCPIDWSVIKPGRTRPATPTNEHTNAQAIDIMVAYWQKTHPEWTPVGWSGANNTGARFWDIRWDAINQLPGSGLLPSALSTALSKAGTYTNAAYGKRQGWREQPWPTDRGYPSKWQGTPEENLKIYRVAARMNGADDVGCIPIDDHFKAVMWGKNGSNCTFEWADVDDFVFTPNDINPTKVTLPNKCKWLAVWTMREPYLQMFPYCVGTMTSSGGGIRAEKAPWGITQWGISNFIHGLGYLNYTNAQSWFIPSGYIGAMGGAGEQSRQGMIMHPKYGLNLRRVCGFITDLPLAETTPVDFGGRNFCKSCGICAENCPFGAIPTGGPTWDATNYQNAGYNTWRMDIAKCIHCPVCQAVCPFDSQDKSTAHMLVRSTAAATPIFDGFFARMERNFGYGYKQPDDFWNVDPFPHGIDTSY